MTVNSCGIVQSTKTWYNSLGELSCPRTITGKEETILKPILNKLS